MQPMGRKPTKFPSKTDCHPKDGSKNWWEDGVQTANKKAERTNAKKAIKKELSEAGNDETRANS